MATSDPKKRQKPVNSSKETRKKLDDLPFVLLFDIFSRLTVFDIIPLRRVCKFWNNLLRDPEFINFHLRRKVMQVVPSHLIIASMLQDEKKSLFLINSVQEIYFRTREIEVDLENQFELVGSCNGLICMAPRRKYDSIFICNPITGKGLSLPKLAEIADGFLSFGPMIVPRTGFGFDDATGKYKVIRFLYDGEGQLGAEIITLGESSWRKLDVPVMEVQYGGNEETALFLNGFLYWVIQRRKEYLKNGYEFILAFDIGSEKFHIVNFVSPRAMNFRTPPDSTRDELHLVNIKGSLVVELFVSFASYELVGLEIWKLVGSSAVEFSLNNCSYHDTHRFQENEKLEFLRLDDTVLVKFGTGSYVRLGPCPSKLLLLTRNFSLTLKKLPVRQPLLPFTPSLVSP